MASKLAKVANALAIGIGAGMQGYGRGALDVAMRNRDELHQQMRDERAAAASAAATKEERSWREGEAEKEREHDFAKMEKAEGYDAASQQRTLDNQLTLAKMRGSGKGGGSGGGRKTTESAYLKRARELEEVRAKAEGREVSEENILKNLETFNAGRASSSGGAGGSSESSYLKRAREQEMLDAQAEGREINDENVARNFKAISGGSNAQSSDVVKPADIARAMQSEYDARSSFSHPDYKNWKNMTEDQRKQVVGSSVLGNLEGAGSVVPERFSNQYTQKSEAEVQQPQSTPAPATDTSGAKPTNATPKGQGTETSPFLIETEEQQEWISKAPGDTYFVIGGKVYHKKAQ